MNIPSQILTLLVGIFITIASLWYGQNHGLLPVAASGEAEQVDELFNTMMTIGFGLFLLVEGTLLVAAFRFRRKEGDMGDGDHLEGNIPLEIVWTAIPAVVVLGISIYSFDIYTRMGGLELMNHDMGGSTKVVELAYASDQPLGADALSDAGLGLSPEAAANGEVISIDVQGLQYAFIFNYPGGIIDGELHVPVDQPVELKLNAQDVLHAFWLPEFRIKQDMIPGQETKLVINATKEGTYPVVCAELCGPYHGGMRTQMTVHSQDDYADWVASRLPQPATEDAPASDSVAQLLPRVNKPAVDKTDAEYLAPFVEPLDLAIAPDALSALHSTHEHMVH